MTKKPLREKVMDGFLAMLSAIDGNMDATNKPGGFAFLIYLVMMPIVIFWPLVFVGLFVEKIFGFWIGLAAGIAAEWW